MAEEKKVGTSLVLPGEITDAIDGDDLLLRLMEENTRRVAERVDKRIVADWVSKQRAEARTRYMNKARAAYEHIWEICNKKKIGHRFTLVEVRGNNINQCEDCRFATFSNDDADHYDYDYLKKREKSIAGEMNDSLVKALADRMIEVDIEAGIFSWPTTDDYPGTPDIDQNPKKKVRWISVRRVS